MDCCENKNNNANKYKMLSLSALSFIRAFNNLSPYEKFYLIRNLDVSFIPVDDELEHIIENEWGYMRCFACRLRVKYKNIIRCQGCCKMYCKKCIRMGNYCNSCTMCDICYKDIYPTPACWRRGVCVICNRRVCEDCQIKDNGELYCSML